MAWLNANWFYFAVPVATLIYLILDIYPQTKSFEAIWRCGAFVLLWLIFTLLNLIAWGVLTVTAGDKITGMLPSQHPELAALVVVVLSTLCTLTILQSFTLKLADTTFIDLGSMVDRYRKSTLEALGDTVITIQRKNEQRVINNLVKMRNLDELREAYHEVMRFGGQDLAAIGADLEEIKSSCEQKDLSAARELSIRIVKTDIGKARGMIHR